MVEKPAPVRVVTTSTLTARWSLGGYAQQYPWPQCRYCGRAQTYDCKPVECLLCGSRQCNDRSECSLCHYGWLPGWWRGTEGDRCGYVRCNEPAVAKAPGIRRVCKAHAGRPKVRLGPVGIPLTEYVDWHIAERDAGRLSLGGQRWRWVQ